MQQIVTKANVKLSNVLKYILSFIQDSKTDFNWTSFFNLANIYQKSFFADVWFLELAKLGHVAIHEKEIETISAQASIKIR